MSNLKVNRIVSRFFLISLISITVSLHSPIATAASFSPAKCAASFVDSLQRLTGSDQLSKFERKVKSQGQSKTIPLYQLKTEGQYIIFKRQKQLHFAPPSNEYTDVQKALPFTVLKSNTEIDLLAQMVVKDGYLKQDVERLIAKRVSNKAERLDPHHVGNLESSLSKNFGPLGLISGIRSWLAGKDVVILEKRVAYVRDQVMGLDSHFMSWIQENAPDLERMMQSLGIFEKRPPWFDLNINGKEFDSIRIQQLENSLALLINELEKGKAGTAGGIKVIRGVEVTGQEGNWDGRTIIKGKFQDGTSMSSTGRIIIGADGANGASKNLFGGVDYPVTNQHWSGPAVFKADFGNAFRFKHNYSGKDFRKLMFENPKGPEIYRKMKAFGWSEINFPAIRSFQNGDIFYVGAEVPQSMGLAMSTDKKLRDEWFTLVKDLAFPEERVGPLSLDETGGGSSVFPVESRRTDRMAHITDESRSRSRLFSKSIFFAVGDNAAGAHFMTRSGINTGFTHTDALEAVLKKPLLESTNNDEIQKVVDDYELDVSHASQELFNRSTEPGNFSDGPFLRKLTSVENKVVEVLKEMKVPHISYTQWVEPLLGAGFDAKNAKHLEVLRKVIAEGGPNMKPAEVIQHTISAIDDLPAEGEKWWAETY
jgi:2-polyprenyl-6-methoxyphenol hydroxylase-like FAD-dependent oxidoreductase